MQVCTKLDITLPAEVPTKGVAGEGAVAGILAKLAVEGTREGEGHAGATRKEESTEEGEAEIVRKKATGLFLFSTDELDHQEAVNPACHPHCCPFS